MDRRDFLFFRTEQRRRVAELSCARLYVRYCDARAAAGDAERAAVHSAEGSASDWGGEPPSELKLATTGQLFTSLDAELRAVDVVRVHDADWLASDDFRREFELVMSSFSSRGGRVEYLNAASSDAAGAPSESVDQRNKEQKKALP